MYWEQALGGSIEVSIAIAGFSGIIAAFGQRSESWQDADQVMLRILLTASSTALFFSILPFVVLDSGIEHSTFWRSASATQACWLISIFIYRSGKIDSEDLTGAIGIRWIAIAAITLIVLIQIGNAFYFALPWLYVVGVIYQLFVALLVFARLLLDFWENKDAT
jgi:hypothetical protein